jgi:hypothetical protein
VDTFSDGSVRFNIDTLLGIREDDNLLLLARRLAEEIMYVCSHLSCDTLFLRGHFKCRRDTGIAMLLSVAIKPAVMNEATVKHLLTYLCDVRPWKATTKQTYAGVEPEVSNLSSASLDGDTEAAARAAYAAVHRSTIRAGPGNQTR